MQSENLKCAAWFRNLATADQGATGDPSDVLTPFVDHGVAATQGADSGLAHPEAHDLHFLAELHLQAVFAADKERFMQFHISGESRLCR